MEKQLYFKNLINCPVMPLEIHQTRINIFNKVIWKIMALIRANILANDFCHQITKCWSEKKITYALTYGINLRNAIMSQDQINLFSTHINEHFKSSFAHNNDTLWIWQRVNKRLRGIASWSWTFFTSQGFFLMIDIGIFEAAVIKYLYRIFFLIRSKAFQIYYRR